MKLEQFNQLCEQGFNRIPVMREVLADLDTPLSSYVKLANGAYSYLFESVQGGEKWGRYSIMGLPCKTVLKVFGYKVTVEIDGDIVETHQVVDPLVVIVRRSLQVCRAFTEALWVTLPMIACAMSSPA
jgi:anthranilate synthase component 1